MPILLPYISLLSPIISIQFSVAAILLLDYAPDFMYDPLDLTNLLSINSPMVLLLSKLSQNSLSLNVTSFIHFIIS